MFVNNVDAALAATSLIWTGLLTVVINTDVEGCDTDNRNNNLQILIGWYEAVPYPISYFVS